MRVFARIFYMNLSLKYSSINSLRYLFDIPLCTRSLDFKSALIASRILFVLGIGVSELSYHVQSHFIFLFIERYALLTRRCVYTFLPVLWSNVRCLSHTSHLVCHISNIPSKDSLSVWHNKYAICNNSWPASVRGFFVKYSTTVLTWWNWQYWTLYCDKDWANPLRPSHTIPWILKLCSRSHSTPYN